jgi:hypothetical protein
MFIADIFGTNHAAVRKTFESFTPTVAAAHRGL